MMVVEMLDISVPGSVTRLYRRLVVSITHGEGTMKK